MATEDPPHGANDDGEAHDRRNQHGCGRGRCHFGSDGKGDEDGGGVPGHHDPTHAPPALELRRQRPRWRPHGSHGRGGLPVRHPIRRGLLRDGGRGPRGVRVPGPGRRRGDAGGRRPPGGQLLHAGGDLRLRGGPAGARVPASDEPLLLHHGGEGRRGRHHPGPRARVRDGRGSQAAVRGELRKKLRSRFKQELREGMCDFEAN